MWIYLSIVSFACFCRLAIADDRLFVREANGGVSIPENLDESGQEELRLLVVNLLSKMYERKILPFNSPKYPHKRGVLDRLPMERFLDEAAGHMGAVELEQ